MDSSPWRYTTDLGMGETVMALLTGEIPFLLNCDYGKIAITTAFQSLLSCTPCRNLASPPYRSITRNPKTLTSMATDSGIAPRSTTPGILILDGGPGTC